MAAERGTFSNRDVVAATGLTRQAVHRHLRQLVERGELERRGAGRGALYVRDAAFDRTLRTSGLDEDAVWRQLDALPIVADLAPSVRMILHYAVTEMVNNALDHASSPDVRVRLWTDGDDVAFAVRDRGVGVFAHVRERLGLPDEITALEAISRGKTTTAPERHTGEGIFFTSKAVDRFVLEGNGLRWTVDNLRRDQAVGEVGESPGTLVRCEIARTSARKLDEVFGEFTTGEDFAFSRSRVPVLLFEREGRFVSRSAARRLAHGLDRFREVVLDFGGVTDVGQGFADELVRVWSRDHPQTLLRVENASPAVHRMIERARAHHT